MRCFLFASLLVAAVFSDVARSQNVALASDLLVEQVGAPGETFEREIALTNATDRPGRVRLRQVDVLNPVAGEYEYPEPGSHHRSNAAWVRLPQEVVTVPADTTISVPFRITVPDTLTSPGTYWSVVMIEPDGTPDAISADLGRVGVNIRQTVRYAMNIATHVNGGRADVQIQSVESVSAQGQDRILLDVRNEGARSVRPRAWVEVYDEDGGLVGTYESNTPLTYPGQHAMMQIVARDIPQGAYTALLYLDGGGDALIGSRLSLDLGSSAAAEAASESEAETLR